MAEIESKEKQANQDTTAIEIMEMQKKYLATSENKILEYDVKEIQKKL